MQNVIITGATGMIGGLVLDFCLASEDVRRVTVITRRSTGTKHPKLVEVIHDNFLDFSPIEVHFRNQDVCLFCIGVYTGSVHKEMFKTITVSYTEAFAKALKRHTHSCTICFLSGQGADQKEQSRILFAREKGVAENLLLKLEFTHTFIFRPGYIYPVTARKEPNFSYRMMRFLYRTVFSWLYPKIGIHSTELAQAMVHVGLQGTQATILENVDIQRIASSLS